MVTPLEIQFNSTLQSFDNQIWGRHIPLPAEISSLFKLRSITRVLCQINKNEAFHAALMPSKKGFSFILISQKRCRDLSISLGEPLLINLVEDQSKYGTIMPEELQYLLDDDPQLGILFEKLTAGKQRGLIYIVSNVKSPEIRIRRAMVVCDHLVIHHGKIDYLALGQELKASNERVNIKK